jgi:hypothetical protein
MATFPEGPFDVVGEAETPTLTKEKRSLDSVRGVGEIEGRERT